MFCEGHNSLRLSVKVRNGGKRIWKKQVEDEKINVSLNMEDAIW